jgi:hypothetical protein
LWVTENFVTKTQLSGGTTGQILTKKSDSDLDVEWTDIEILTVNLNGVDMLLDPDKTYLVIKIPADNDTFTLLTRTTGSPNYTIDWGDGLSETITDTSNPTHEYETAGMYLITISGAFENGIVYGSSANVNKNKIIEVYGGSNYPLSIGNTAFYGCTSLTTAYFPKLTSIGISAFQDCTSLTTVNIPKATSIDYAAFQDCTNLTTVNILNATSIGDYAFRNCTSLTTANFPRATSIGSNAFRSCTSLTTVNIPNATSIDIFAFQNCTSLKELTIGNVTSISAASRFQNVKLANLTIAQDVTDTDIERIKQFYADNGGTFTGSELKYSLQIEKPPIADNDVVRKVDLDLVKNLIPTQVNRYFTEATQTLFAKSFYTMQSDKPTDPIANIDTTITATSQGTAQVLARFTTADGLSSEINLPPQNTEVNIEAVRTAGTQNVRIFARGYIMDDAGNETLLSTSNVATLTNASVNHILLLPIPAYTAPVGSRVVIEILSYRVSGSGTHTARIRVNDDTMSKWSYNRSLADLNLDAKNITYNNTTSGLTADNVQDALDELESTKQDELVSGVDIKTINNISLLGSGDITISGGAINGIDFLKDPAKTYLVIKIPADNDTFTLLTGTTGSPNYTIDWGDGLSETITTTDNPVHEYSKAGMYLITISGAFENGIEYGISYNENKNKIIEVYGGNNYPLSIETYAFYNCNSLTTAIFHNVTSIGAYAFQSCSLLATANFPNAMSIGNLAFDNCTSLTTISIPNATSIGNSAFYSCSSLTTANFPNATSIGSGTFRNCTSLTTANFPKVTNIADNAFYNCTSLKELTIGNIITPASGTRFENVKLTNLTIAQDVTDADIERIKQFYADDGGAFIGSELKHSLRVEKAPTLIRSGSPTNSISLSGLVNNGDILLVEVTVNSDLFGGTLTNTFIVRVGGNATPCGINDVYNNGTITGIVTYWGTLTATTSTLSLGNTRQIAYGTTAASVGSPVTIRYDTDFGEFSGFTNVYKI